MARKPLAESTVALNVLKYGTGGINIDESRVDVNPEIDDMHRSVNRKKRETETWENGSGFKNETNSLTGVPANGRFPANLIHDNSEEVRECFPKTKSGLLSKHHKVKGSGGNSGFLGISMKRDSFEKDYGGDQGSASRFFKSIIYVPKASKAERNKGCDGLEEKPATARMNASEFRYEEGREPTPRAEQSVNKNHHPTVKPIALMEYLIKMVTPKGGTVLDPFMGSGSTGVAAKQNDFKFIGIDITPEYIEIAKARINGVKEQAQTILQF